MIDCARVPGLVELLVRRYEERAGPEDAVEWATELLERGFDTPNLRVLAGLSPDPDSADVERHLQLALEELACDRWTENQARTAYALVTAQRIVAGDVEPVEGCRAIYSSVARPFQYPTELSAWVHLDDGRLPESPYSEMGDAELAARIVGEAKLLIEYLGEHDLAPAVPIRDRTPRLSLGDRVRLAFRKLTSKT
jgi:hypothetical protein